MRRIVRIITVVCIIFLLPACSNDKIASGRSVGTGDTSSASAATGSQVKYSKTERITAKSLEGNKVNIGLDQFIYIMLPPSYYDTNKKYPVVYYLSGHGGSSTEILSYSANVGNAMKDGTIKEFIIIGIGGQNSFYVNSAVRGNWEDFVLNDVVNYIDSNYRTIDKAESRGIMGFSMGGSGAFNLAFKHPDIFSSVFSFAPGLFDENGLRNAFDDWDNSFKQEYGMAFSANLENPPSYANIPKFDGSEQDDKIIKDWENGFGNLEEKVDNYLKSKTKLKAIMIEYGANDGYTWIPEGCKYLSGILNERKIVCEIKENTGSHSLSSSLFKESILPFFSKNLKFK